MSFDIFQLKLLQHLQASFIQKMHKANTVTETNLFSFENRHVLSKYNVL